MKTIFRISLIASALVFPLCSCSDFLEKEPFHKEQRLLCLKLRNILNKRLMHCIIQKAGKIMMERPIMEVWTKIRI